MKLLRWTKRRIRLLVRRKFGVPLVELAAFGEQITHDPQQMCVGLLGADASTLAELHEEFAAVSAELSSCYDRLSLHYPDFWRVDPGTSALLYFLVRLLRPSHVFETGVANGHSSHVLLAALKSNGGGVLHSVDILHDVGSLVPGSYRNNWNLVLLDPHRPRFDLLSYLRGLPPLDLFIHDSDHSYRNQAFEYRTFASKLSPGGILASDDVDSSYAFMDFCHAFAARPSFLVDTRKVFGAVRLPLQTIQPS